MPTPLKLAPMLVISLAIALAAVGRSATLSAGSPDQPIPPRGGLNCAWQHYRSGLPLGGVSSNDRLTPGPHGNGIAQIYAVFARAANGAQPFLAGFLYRPFNGDWGFEAAVEDPSPHLWFGMTRQPSGNSDDAAPWIEEAQLDARKLVFKEMRYRVSAAVASADTTQPIMADEKPCFSAVWDGS